MIGRLDWTRLWAWRNSSPDVQLAIVFMLVQYSQLKAAFWQQVLTERRRVFDTVLAARMMGHAKQLYMLNKTQLHLPPREEFHWQDLPS